MVPGNLPSQLEFVHVPNLLSNIMTGTWFCIWLTIPGTPAVPFGGLKWRKSVRWQLYVVPDIISARHGIVYIPKRGLDLRLILTQVHCCWQHRLISVKINMHICFAPLNTTTTRKGSGVCFVDLQNPLRPPLQIALHRTVAVCHFHDLQQQHGAQYAAIYMHILTSNWCM